MIHPKELERINNEATRRALEKKQEPYVLFDKEDIDKFPPFPFTHLGDYTPPGWELLEDQEPLFCDTTGFGKSSEPALTTAELKRELRKLYDQNPNYGYAVIEIGQFQLYLGVFRRTNDNKS